MILVHIWWTFWHWFQVQTGTIIPPTGSREYNFWSGWGSVFVLPLLITLGHYIVDRFTHTCHVPGCYRKGKHQIAGGRYTVCTKHHPDTPDDGLTLEHIQSIHRKFNT